MSGAAFKWEDHPEAPATGAKFSWDDHPEVPSASNAGGAALEGFGNGASLGYLPQLQALAYKGTEGLANAVGLGDGTDEKLKAQGFIINQSPDTYTGLRDENIARQKGLAKSNPYSYYGGMLAGGVATAPLAEGAATGLIGKGAGAAAKAATTGALIGAAQNPGDTEGQVDPLQALARVKNGAIGAGLGLAGNKLASMVGSAPEALQGAGEGLEAEAEKNALRTVGAQKPQMRALNNQGRTQDVGRFIMDEGIAPIGADADTIATNAAAAKNKYGKAIGDVFDKIEDTGGGATFNRKEMATAMREALAGDDNVAGSLDSEEVMGKLEKYITNFEKGEGPASARDLLALKGKFDGRINYSKATQDLPELQAGYKNLRSTINEAINDRANALSNKVRGDLGSQLKSANQNYGLASATHDLAQNKLAMQGNNYFSLTDRMAAGVGGAAGLLHGGLTSIPMAIAAAGASKAARTYGPGVMTAVADGAGGFLQGAGNLIDGPALPAAGEALSKLAPSAAAAFQRDKLNPYTRSAQ